MEGTLAEIKLFAGNFAPRCWAFCEGQTLPISGNEALFSLLGTQYGGDGRVNFKLPDMRPLDANSKPKFWEQNEPRQIICIQGMYPMRS